MLKKTVFMKTFYATQHPDIQRLKTGPYLTDHLTPSQQREENELKEKVNPPVDQPSNPSISEQGNAGTSTQETPPVPKGKRGRKPGGTKRAAESQQITGIEDEAAKVVLLSAKKLRVQKRNGGRVPAIQPISKQVATSSQNVGTQGGGASALPSSQ
jgi:hypothetical protein